MQLGGIQRVALNLSSGLVEAGYTVDVVLVNAKGELIDELPAEVCIVDFQCDRVARSILPLRQYIRTKNPDVIYSMMTEINLVTIAAHAFARNECRIIISEHNMLTKSTTSLKDRAIVAGAALAYPFADHAVAVSQGVFNDLLNVTRLNKSNITRIYNPTNVDEIRQKATEPIDHRWLSDESCDVVISAGRHVQQKGFDTLINAFARADFKNTKLILLGKGNETGNLRELTKSLGINSDVDFPGFVENPYNYISQSDVFVLSSEYEGFGMVLVEAMACGCPVVSTDCPSGPAEILDGGTYGHLFPVGDIGEMTNAMDSMLKSPIEKATLVDRANDFSVQSVVKEYESVFFPQRSR